MPRKRMIDPAFWDDLTLGKLSRDARLCFIGLLSNADDYGRVEVDPLYVKRAVFGFDVDLGAEEVAIILSELCRSARNLRFYTADGRHVAVFLNWQRYQYIQKPRPSTLPAPPALVDVESATVPVSYKYDTPTVPVQASRALANRIEKNRREINAAEIAHAHEAPPPPPVDLLKDRLGKYDISDNQLRKVSAAFQSKNHNLTPNEFDRIDTYLTLPGKTIGILLGSFLYSGKIPQVTNGHSNGLSPPRPPQPDLHEARDEHGDLYLALPDGTRWEPDE